MSLKKGAEQDPPVFIAIKYSGYGFLIGVIIILTIWMIKDFDIHDYKAFLSTSNVEIFIPLITLLVLSGASLGVASYLRTIPKENIMPVFKDWVLFTSLLALITVSAFAVYQW